jgi:hypothetical protein
MKNAILLLLLSTLIICISCKHKSRNITVENLTTDYTFEQIDSLYSLKVDSTRNIEAIISDDLKELSKDIEVDTLLKAAKVLYGPDDRVDFFEEKDTNKIKNALGVVALVRDFDLSQEQDKKFKMSTISFIDAQSLCTSEKFKLQPISSFCSGFAISKNVIVTAGHCIESEDDLKTIRFVFDFKYVAEGSVKTVFEKQLILSGKRIISRINSGNMDYSIIETNEIIPEDRRLKLNIVSKIKDKESVYVIGHPAGLPLKIAGGAFVRNNTDSLFFSANLDTYGGNSGSPVFNSRTHLVEGILVRGETDFIKSSSGNCMISNPCPNNGCKGEDVSRVSQFKNKL